MSDGIYWAGAGMVSRQVWQNAVSENIANVSTPGYKASRMFASMLDEVQSTAAGLRAVEQGQHSFTDFSQGQVEQTGRDLDLALDGEGFFVVRTPQGECFTRNGNFRIDAQGTLVDASGAAVLGAQGPLVLPQGKVQVGDGGVVSVDGARIGSLQLRNFASRETLQRADHGAFALRAGANVQDKPATARLRQGYLERSNAEPLDEMVRMLNLVRGFEASQRVARLQSETLGRVVNELIQR
jgi:flagellar basal-body rod protein FlgG